MSELDPILLHIDGDSSGGDEALMAIDEALGALDEEFAALMESIGAVSDALAAIGEAATAGSDGLSALDAAASGADDALASIGAAAGDADAAIGTLGASAADASAGLDAATTSALADSTAIAGMATANTDAAVALDANSAATDANTAAKDANSAANDGNAASASKLNLLLIGAGVAIAAAGVMAVKSAGDFQASMTQLVTGAGEAQSNIGLISSSILQMAVDTGTSTSQLADGMFTIDSATNALGVAGDTAAKRLVILRDAAEGAKTGNADLATETKAVTAVMADYADQHVTAANAVNFLSAVVSNGNTHLQELAGAMSSILPTASAVKVNMDDVGGALATMTGESIPAADAATYLRQLLIALSAPAKAGAQSLTDIGLTTQQVSDEMKRSLPDTLKLIMTHLAETYKVGSPEYVAALKNIAGGSKQMQGLLALTGEHLAVFATNTKTVADAVNHGGDAIAHWSDVQQDFNFKVDRAREAVATFGIELGTKALPALGDFAVFFTAHIMPAVQGFTDFLLKNHDALAITAGVLGGIFLAALYSVLSALGAMALAAAPIIGIFVGISVAAALLATHWQQVVGFFESSNPVLVVIKGVLLALTGALMGLGVALIGEAIPGIMASVAAFMMQAAAAADAALAMLAAAAIPIAIGAAIAVLIGVIILLITHWKQVTTFLAQIWANIGVTAKNIWNGIASFFTGLWQGIENTAKTVWNAIVSFFVGIFDAIKATVQNFVNGVVALFSWLYDHNYYFQALVMIIQKAFQWIHDTALAIWHAITNFLEMEWRGIQIMAQLAWSLVQQYIITPIENTWHRIQAVGQYIITALQITWNTVKADVTAAWNAFIGVISGLWNRITTAIHDNVVKPITDEIQKIINLAESWGKALIDMFVKGITGAAGAVGQAIGNIAGGIGKFLGFHSPAEEGPGKDADKWMPNLGTLLASSLDAQAAKIKASANKVAASLLPLSGVNASALGTLNSGALPANSQVIALLAQIVQGLQRGQTQTPNLGPMSTSVTNNNTFNTNTVASVQQLYRLMNQVAGYAAENASRGATAGLGI